MLKIPLGGTPCKPHTPTWWDKVKYKVNHWISCKRTEWDIIMGYLSPEGEPLKCDKCKCDEVVSKVTSSQDHYAHEMSYHCGQCSRYLGYWAYGSFEPRYF